MVCRAKVMFFFCLSYLFFQNSVHREKKQPAAQADAVGCYSLCSWLQGHLQSVAQADAASCFDKPCFGKALSMLPVGYSRLW